MRYRKNITCLTTDELHDLREAFAGIYALPAGDPNSFAKVAGFHGGPPTAYCRHGAPGFFTWHRAYMVAIENALRSLRCDVNLPFWDWSSGPSTGVPEPCRNATYVNRSGDTVPNPLYSGPDASGVQTSRRADIDTTAFDDLATTAQTALTAATFDSFQSQINGVHGSVHVRTGGDMGFVPTASYDPIFYFHHANVDRLWAQWQAANPGVALPGTEATFELEPFNRPYSIQWQEGSDVESTDALGYRYRRFCFYLPPFRIWEVIKLDLHWPFREQVKRATLAIKSHHLQARPVEIRAFLNQPDATGQTRTIGNPAFAGAVGFLGHGPRGRHVLSSHDCPECAAAGNTLEHGHHLEHRRDGDDQHGEGHHEAARPRPPERFDIELDVTAALKAIGGEAQEATLKLVAVDIDGNEVLPGDVFIEGAELDLD